MFKINDRVVVKDKTHGRYGQHGELISHSTLSDTWKIKFDTDGHQISLYPYRIELESKTVRPGLIGPKPERPAEPKFPTPWAVKSDSWDRGDEHIVDANGKRVFGVSGTTEFKELHKLIVRLVNAEVEKS